MIKSDCSDLFSVEGTTPLPFAGRRKQKRLHAIRSVRFEWDHNQSTSDYKAAQIISIWAAFALKPTEEISKAKERYSSDKVLLLAIRIHNSIRGIAGLSPELREVNTAIKGIAINHEVFFTS